MAYTVACPLMNRTFARNDREAAAALLRDAGVTRVFLALGTNCLAEPDCSEETRLLRENSAFLKARGFEVGAWLWAFLYTLPADFVRMRAPDGRVSAMTVCPTDPAYRREMGLFLREIAETGVDMIMFDDDYRYGFQDMGFGCVCENHRAMIEQTLGRPVSEDELRAALLSGGQNEVRNAFVQANGRALCDFAEEMRRALDETAPGMRLGFCACITSWDLDGAVPDEISRRLAGNTRPFYRLIGAPYWAPEKHWGNRLGDVIDLTRAEAARRKDEEIEIFSEGDTFPRPRYATPASYLECYDTALRAAGCADGILKYMLDYTGSPDYEPGYIAEAIRNRPLYAAIDDFFGGKTACGVRVYDNPEKYRTLPIPKRMEGNAAVQEIAFSAAARFLTGCSIPAVFEGGGVCGIAFGEDARTLPEEALNKGLILDAAAAEILTQRGIDTGLLRRGSPEKTEAETFADGRRVGFLGPPLFCPCELSPKAHVLSVTQHGGKNLPLSYTYENAGGQRFLVYTYESVFAPQRWFRSYLRQAQVNGFVRACGAFLPACCPGHPEAYLLVKTDGRRTAIGVWNLFADVMRSPAITLPAPARVLRACGCTAKAEGDKLTLSDIPAFGCALVETEQKMAVDTKITR